MDDEGAVPADSTSSGGAEYTHAAFMLSVHSGNHHQQLSLIECLGEHFIMGGGGGHGSGWVVEI